MATTAVADERMEEVDDEAAQVIDPIDCQREYHALQWRLEIPIASRTNTGLSATSGGTAPVLQLQFQLADTGSIADAAVAPSGDRIRSEWVATDYEGLVKLRDMVADAVSAMHEAPYRRMQRIVK